MTEELDQEQALAPTGDEPISLPAPFGIELLDGSTLDVNTISGVRSRRSGNGLHSVEVEHRQTGVWMAHYETRDQDKAEGVRKRLVAWLYGEVMAPPAPDPAPAAVPDYIPALVPQSDGTDGRHWEAGKPMPRDPWRMPATAVGPAYQPVSPWHPDDAEKDRQEAARQAGATPGDNGALGFLPTALD